MDYALLMVGIKKDSSNYEIVMVNSGDSESLLVKEDKLLYPTTYNGSEIVYVGINKEQSYLGL